MRFSMGFCVASADLCREENETLENSYKLDLLLIQDASQHQDKHF